MSECLDREFASVQGNAYVLFFFLLIVQLFIVHIDILQVSK